MKKIVKIFLIVIIVLVVLIAVIVGGFFLLRGRVNLLSKSYFSDKQNKEEAMQQIQLKNSDGIKALESGLLVVRLDGDDNTISQNTDKPDLTTTSAIRMILDKAATVAEAVELLSEYDLHASMNFMVHFAIADVTFEPGCRNHWHIHKATSGGGQYLVCTAGEGWYQEEGKKAKTLKPGDTIFVKPGVKHWHGAKKDKWFSHLSIEVPGENCSNEWLEEVSDRHYQQLEK